MFVWLYNFFVFTFTNLDFPLNAMSPSNYTLMHFLLLELTDDTILATSTAQKKLWAIKNEEKIWGKIPTRWTDKSPDFF